MEYFHVVFTLPTEIAQIAFWNKKAVYDLLFRASAETVMTIAADPKRSHAPHRGTRRHDHLPIPQTIVMPAQAKAGPADPACSARPPRLFPDPLCPETARADANNGHGLKPRPTPATTLSALSQ